MTQSDGLLNDSPSRTPTQTRVRAAQLPPAEFMGDWDASIDTLLASTFVKFFDDEILIHESTVVILAGKGAGKTALVKELIKTYKHDHITVSANHIAFRRVVDQWQRVRSDKVSDPQHLVEAWKVFFHAVAMAHVVQDADVFAVEGLPPAWATAIDTFLRQVLGIPEHERMDRRRMRELIAGISSQVLKIATLGRLKIDPAPLANVVVQRTALELYAAAVGALRSLLRHRGRRVLIALDEFDTFFSTQLRGLTYDAAQEAAVHDILFALLEAVKELGGDAASTHLKMKILFPRDRFPSHYRDRVKTMQHLQPIFWTPSHLLEFCCRRIGYRFGLMNGSQAIGDPRSTWYSLFPQMVENKGRSRQTKENSFDYVLRHTYYRPRDLQIQISAILEVWRERHSSTIPLDGLLTDDIIRAGIERANSALYDAVIDEFREEHPYLEMVIAGLRRFPTVFRYDSQLEAALKKGIKIAQSSVAPHITITNRHLLQILLEVGVLGRFDVADEIPEPQAEHLGLQVRRVDRMCYKSGFFFSDRHGRPPSVAEDEWLCVHPIFHEKLECKPSELYIVGGGRLGA